VGGEAMSNRVVSKSQHRKVKEKKNIRQTNHPLPLELL
jgi:hypothetical protein